MEERGDGDQRWFWEPGWLAGEHEADLDLRAGRWTRLTREDDLLAQLDPEG